jgi:hypothetical protein
LFLSDGAKTPPEGRDPVRNRFRTFGKSARDGFGFRTGNGADDTLEPAISGFFRGSAGLNASKDKNYLSNSLILNFNDFLP